LVLTVLLINAVVIVWTSLMTRITSHARYSGDTVHDIVTRNVSG
jgi:hypothetical protein